MFKSIKRLAIVATLIAAAIIPSAAYARPILPDREPYFVTPAMLQIAPPASAHHVAASATAGFSWHDAGVGAAGMLVLVGLGTAATFAVRRRSTRLATS